MTTLIGSEGVFSFQNLNIQRGLLVNQENFINQGVQVDWANGPWSASFAATDGFFSGELDWFTDAITCKIDDANTIGINGGTHFTSFELRPEEPAASSPPPWRCRTAASSAPTTPTRPGPGS